MKTRTATIKNVSDDLMKRFESAAAKEGYSTNDMFIILMMRLVRENERENVA